MNALGYELSTAARRTLASVGALLARRRAPRILMYHRVCDDRHRLAVPLATFLHHLDMLADEGYTVLSVSELLSAVDAGVTDDQRLVALSFDDGYLEMATEVAPELARRGMNATFFVLPHFHTSPRNLAPEMAWRDGCPYLSPGTIVGLAHQGFEVAAHGRLHHVLTTVDDATAWREIDGGRRELEALIERPVLGLAYPCGAHRSGHAAMADAAGYNWAVTVQPGTVTAHAPRFTLPRTEVAGGDQAATVKHKLLGGLDAWHAGRQWLARPRLPQEVSA